VTGVGVVAPSGLDASSFFSSLQAADAPARPVDVFDATAFPCAVAGQIRGFDPLTWVVKKKKLKLMGPNVTFAVAAAAQAAQQAGLQAGVVAAERLGVTLGGRTRISDFDELEKCVISSLGDDDRLSYAKYATEGMHHVYPLSMLRNLPNMATAHLSIIHGALGPTDSITNGAPSALQAIGESFRTIQRGDADVMLTGGTDSLVTPLDLGQLTSLGILLGSADESCRPFDQGATGGMPGEGAAIFVLEAAEHARARGATVLAEIKGFAEGFEPVFPTGDPVRSATWRRALDDADLQSADVGAVVLAGAGHAPWDRFEAAMARPVFPDGGPPMWSSRAPVGFAGAAISALDLAAALASAGQGVVPPTANCRQPIAEATGLDLVIGEPRAVTSPVRLVTSYNRAGAVAALVVAA